ncbi:MAG: hypothetical protein Q9197_004549, partial [Variospora fuerteventurae]
MEELYSDADVNGLNVIHVSGTKGKGSTCAFINSFLTAHGERTGFPRKIGLYTSPHLKHVRERIQINSKPLSEKLFAKYVFQVWHGLSGKISPGPRYLQLLFLISVHAFINEGIDVAIYETHNGGEFDATNVIQKPVVTGVTTIGMDHVEQLGPLIENIAWHKAGIFKHGSPAFSTFQEPAAATVLQQRASEKNVTLHKSTPLCTRILIFSHISERDGAAILKGVAETLHRAGLQINHVILSTYEERQQDGGGAAVSM